jgi:pimeloyl-ACP methyl ester carboxylesterase
MSWHFMQRNGARLSGFDGGAGAAVIFQHGLGGDEAQVAEVFPASGFRRLTLECRGQGGSEAGSSQHFSISQFADDIMAFADLRGVERFLVGGISMGAAIALRIAVLAPDRVSGLILGRPAWNWEAAPANMQVFTELSAFVAKGDRAGFEASATAQHFAQHAPDNFASLLRFFDRNDRLAVARLLASIAADGPGISERDVRSLQVPTLIVANGIDLVHPMAQAKLLAAAIAGSRLVEITPKAEDRVTHSAEFRAAITEFLQHEGLHP